MGLLSDDICFHVAWSFTSSTDSPFSLKSFLPPPFSFSYLSPMYFYSHPLATQWSSFTTSTPSPLSSLSPMHFYSHPPCYTVVLLHHFNPSPPLSSHSPIFLLCTSIPTPLATQWSSFTTSTPSPLSSLSPMHFYSHPPLLHSGPPSPLQPFPPPSLLILLSFSYVLLFPSPFLHSAPPSPLQPFPPPPFSFSYLSPMYFYSHPPSYTVLLLHHFNPFPPSLLTLLSFSYVLLFPPPCYTVHSALASFTTSTLFPPVSRPLLILLSFSYVLLFPPPQLSLHVSGCATLWTHRSLLSVMQTPTESQEFHSTKLTFTWQQCCNEACRVIWWFWSTTGILALAKSLDKLFVHSQVIWLWLHDMVKAHISWWKWVQKSLIDQKHTQRQCHLQMALFV